MKSPPGFWRRSSAHPRRCGADELGLGPAMTSGGSSPQVRGRLNPRSRGAWPGGSSPQVRGRSPACGAVVGATGLIPAGAGQMFVSSRILPAAPAHPRRCGADMNEQARAAAEEGSSPQVRGRFLCPTAAPLAARLIPAGAGQILFRAGRAPVGEAHPRRCGADFTSGNIHTILQGSSPQVRGRLLGVVGNHIPKGLIPAGAGQMW